VSKFLAVILKPQGVGIRDQTGIIEGCRDRYVSDGVRMLFIGVVRLLHGQYYIHAQNLESCTDQWSAVDLRVIGVLRTGDSILIVETEKATCRRKLLAIPLLVNHTFLLVYDMFVGLSLHVLRHCSRDGKQAQQ